MCVVMDCRVSSAMQCNRLVLAVVQVLVLVVPVLLALLVQQAYGEQRVSSSSFADRVMERLPNQTLYIGFVSGVPFLISISSHHQHNPCFLLKPIIVTPFHLQIDFLDCI